MVDAVGELAREQGLDAPRLFWNPLDASPGGLAFGHPGRYSVALDGRPRRQAGDRPAGVPRGRPPRARAHSQPRRRHHLLHARRSGTRSSSSPSSRSRSRCSTTGVSDLERHLAAARARCARLPDPQRRPALTRGLRRPARVRPRRAGRSAAARPRGSAATCRRIRWARLRRVHPDPDRRLAALDDTRPLFPLGAVVAFAAGLTGNDRLRERRPRCSRPSSPTRSTCASSPRSRSRRSPSASSASRSGGRRSPRSPTGASPPRPGSTRSRLPPASCSARSSRWSGSSTVRGHPAPRPDSVDGLAVGGRARRRSRAPARVDQDERVALAPRARRPPLACR